MFEKLSVTKMAQALAAHSGSRLGLIAQNVANADTPKYRAKDLSDFASAYLERTQPFALQTSNPKHLSSTPTPRFAAVVEAGDSMSPNGNDVSLDLQMMKAVQTRQGQEMALAVYRSASSIIRSSLGRNQ